MKREYKAFNSKQLFEYIKEQYCIEPEYLWNDTPEVAVFRHKRKKKWFGLLMNENGEEYKEHWNTIIISRKVDIELVYELINRSFELTKKHK